jgi:hypothetical protein
MITIFVRFFSNFRRKIGVFFKYHVMIKFVQNLALFCVKNANFFAKFFGENILKIITSIPVYYSYVCRQKEMALGALYIPTVFFWVSNPLCLSYSSALHFFQLFFSGPPPC